MGNGTYEGKNEGIYLGSTNSKMWLFVVANQLEKIRSRSNQLEDDAGPIIMTPFCRRNTEKSDVRRDGVGCAFSQIFSRVGIEGQVEVAVLQHDRSGWPLGRDELELWRDVAVVYGRPSTSRTCSDSRFS